MDNEEVTLEDELLLQAYLDGELSTDEQQVVAERLSQEPALTAVLTQWQGLMVELDTLPEPQLTRDLTASVLAQLEPPPMQLNRTWQPVLVAQIGLALLTTLLAWPLLASWTAVRLALPDWAVALRPAWSGVAQEWMVWWTANMAVDVWLMRWTAVWQGVDQTFSVSLSLLLPLAVLATLAWLVSLRFIWRSTPSFEYVKG